MRAAGRGASGWSASRHPKRTGIVGFHGVVLCSGCRQFASVCCVLCVCARAGVRVWKREVGSHSEGVWLRGLVVRAADVGCSAG